MKIAYSVEKSKEIILIIKNLLDGGFINFQRMTNYFRGLSTL